MKTIKISDWTIAPGFSKSSEGPYSGEEYRKTILAPEFADALAHNQKLKVDLEGTLPYFPSFLREAFGGLALQFKPKGTKVLDNLIIYSPDRPLYENRAKHYILEAEGAF